MRVLVVFEIVPEDFRLYILEGEEAELALKCHRLLVGVNDSEDLDNLCEILGGKTAINSDSPVDLQGVDKVVVTGQIL